MPGRRGRKAPMPAARPARCCSACRPSAHLRHDHGGSHAPGVCDQPRSWKWAMLTAAAVCPHPPLLIPAALGAAASDPPAALRAVRDACDVAVRALAAAGPDLLAVVGGGPADREYDATAAGSLGEFGVPVTVGDGEPVLPLSLTVGRWLLGRAGLAAGPGGPGHGSQVLLQAVDQRASADDCLKLGAAIAERATRVALLAMGDASARRARDTEGAPDRLAREYDEEVAEALAAADARWLGRLDPTLDA